MDASHFITFGLGIIIGIIALGITSACQHVDEDGNEDRREQKEHPDTAALNFLDGAEHSIFFNNQAGDCGMWGLLDPNNKLVAVGHTLRGLVARAKDKMDAEGGDELHDALDGVDREEPGRFEDRSLLDLIAKD